MMKCIKILFCLYLIIPCTKLFADYTLKVIAPRVSDTNVQTALDSAALSIQASLDNDHFSKLGDLGEMSRGFANATSAVSYAGTNQSFQNYSLFSIMGGAFLGVSVPRGSWSAKAVEDKINTYGDTYLGAVPSFALSVGMPFSFMNEKIYVSGKIGGANIKTMSGDVTYSANDFLMGVGLNYVLLDNSKYFLMYFAGEEFLSALD